MFSFLNQFDLGDIIALGSLYALSKKEGFDMKQKKYEITIKKQEELLENINTLQSKAEAYRREAKDAQTEKLTTSETSPERKEQVSDLRKSIKQYIATIHNNIYDMKNFSYLIYTKKLDNKLVDLKYYNGISINSLHCFFHQIKNLNKIKTTLNTEIHKTVLKNNEKGKEEIRGNYKYIYRLEMIYKRSGWRNWLSKIIYFFYPILLFLSIGCVDTGFLIDYLYIPSEKDKEITPENSPEQNAQESQNKKKFISKLNKYRLQLKETISKIKRKFIFAIKARWLIATLALRIIQ